MFDSLSDRLNGIFSRLSRRASLGEKDVDAALREVRVALLEADVALPVVKDFIKTVRERAIGEETLKSVKPGQQVVKVVHDALVDMLGEKNEALDLSAAKPAPVMLVGLQGSGKTTTAGKLAKRLQEKENRKVLMASLDIYRPAARQQLAQVGEQSGTDVLEILGADETPLDIAERAMDRARREDFDVVILDTAGRLHIDDPLMDEAAAVREKVRPVETLLVADAMTGQDAVSVAEAFRDKVGVSGIVLTRVDGDARGGAALSMRSVTGRPIKFLGVGEKLDALDPFHPERLAGRILDMGDVVSLVEQAAEKVDQKEAERVGKRMMSGRFDLEDMLSQLKQLKKMGDMKGLMGMLPGMNQMKKKMAGAAMDDGTLKKTEAVLLSMTPEERRRPALIKASRKKRIAAGSGTTVADVNKVLKQHTQMGTMMKKMKKLQKSGQMPDLFGGEMPPGLSGKEGEESPLLSGNFGTESGGGALPGFPPGKLKP